jgi:hypothetical protein
VHFLWAKGLNSKDIYKEMFPVYFGKCSSCKALHNGVEKFSEGRSKVTAYAQLGVEVAETAVKRLICCGFRRTGKATGQVYQCWWKICREVNVFFSRFEYHMFYVLYPFVTYLLTLRCIINFGKNYFAHITAFHVSRTHSCTLMIKAV